MLADIATVLVALALAYFAWKLVRVAEAYSVPSLTEDDVQIMIWPRGNVHQVGPERRSEALSGRNGRAS